MTALPEIDASERGARVAAPVREAATRTLRIAITSGKIGPGQRLNEGDLAQWLQVSRTTVRESLRQLEAEQIIELVPGKGAVVVRVSDEDAGEFYEVREALECMAVKLFTDRHSAEQAVKLREQLETLRETYGRGSIPEMVSAKDRFYDLIYEGAGNKILQEQAHLISARVAQLRRSSLSSPERRRRSLEELELMLAAIERRDVNAAYRACETHLRNAAAAAVYIRGAEPSSDPE